MSVIQGRIQAKYKYDYERVIDFLLKGLEPLSSFIGQLHEVTCHGCAEEEKYTAKVLFPLIEKAKSEFDRMEEYAKYLLTQINSDMERCIADLKLKNDKLKETVSLLKEIEKELEGTKKAIDNADDQCRRKREDLTDAENALSDASRKREDAKVTQTATLVVGATTFVASALITFFVPPLGIFGMATGVGTEIVGVTVLEENVSLCSKNVSSAYTEVISSQSTLEKAKYAQIVIGNKLYSVKKTKQQAETEMEEAKADKNVLEEYRNCIITFDENYKTFYRQLCDFYGKCKILRCETSGGYSLYMLQSPTKMIGVSLSSLCQCKAIQALCDQQMLTTMRKHLLQIESVNWRTNEQSLEMDDLI